VWEGRDDKRVKLLMQWDIRPGYEAAYFEFVVREFAPGLMRLGLQPTDVWYTVYGDHPQILAGSIAEDLPTMRRILQSPEWEALLERLFQYVQNFQKKIVPARERFQL